MSVKILLWGASETLSTPVSLNSVCTLTCRLTEREEKEIEYKETVYTLAREHEKVGTLHTVLLSQATCM